jgi:hypothetical protein
MSMLLKSLLLSFTVVSAIAPAMAKDDPPEVSIEGLGESSGLGKGDS